MIRFNPDNTISTDPITYPKKITGTKLPQILGINSPYVTPFQVWCDNMKVYKKAFVDNEYTIAGKKIEPKLAEYFRNKYRLTSLISPSDKYGEDYFSTTYGDFFRDTPIFGGMWDYLYYKDGQVASVIEMKTAKAKKRKQDWTNSNGEKIIPSNYVLQTGEYAVLLKCDVVTFVTAFLEDEDYKNPDAFVPNDENTQIYTYRLSKDQPRFIENYMDPAKEWWKKHILTGVSPKYDLNNKDDREIVEYLRSQCQFDEQMKLEAVEGKIFW